MIRSVLPVLLAAALLACGGTNKPGPVNGGGGGTTGTGGDGGGGDTAGQGTWKSGPPVKVTTVEGITEYRLDNGLRVLLFPDDSQEKVTVNITYFVGSRHEGYGEAGMAHLLEHMVFKGTPKHPDIWKSLQDHGAQFNGTTWFDRTNYYETMAATEENLAFALGMEADRMVNSTIAADQLAKEFSVVRNEFEKDENNPGGVLLDRVMSAAYLWHNYGKSTIGNRSDIEKVPADSLRAFYKKYYRPDNAMLVVAGKFDEAKALELIGQHFGTIPKPAAPLAPTYTTEPVQDGEREVILRRTGDAQYVIAGYHGVPGAHPDAPAFDAAATILTDEPSGALYKALVEKKLASSVQAFVFPTQEPGIALFIAEVPKNGNIEKTRDTMLAVIEGFGKAGPSDKEVARYIRQGQKQMDQLWSNSQYTAIRLTEFAAMGDWRMLFVTRDRTDKINKADVQRLAKQYFKRSNRTVGLFIPTDTIDRAPQPEQPDVVAVVKDYKGRDKSVAEGEAFDPTYDNIEARTERSALKVGMKLALLPKRTRGNKVVGTILLHFGDEKSLAKLATASGLVGDVMMRGAKGMSYQEIKDKLDELKSSVSIDAAGPGSAVINIISKRDQLPEVIDLVATVLSSPSFAAAEFELVKREAITTLESQLQDPQALAITALRRTMMPFAPTDVRYIPTVEEDVARHKALKLADLKKVHAMWGASHAEGVFVGDFDDAALKKQLAAKLDGWKTRGKYKRVAKSYKKSPGGEEVIQTPDKKMAFILAAKTVKLRDDDPDYAALALAGYVLGGGGSSRLTTRLRHKDGLSYGAFGGVQADPPDDLGAFFGGALLAPENADKGMAAILEEIKKLIAEGIPDKELEDAKAAFLKQSKTQRANDQAIAGMLASGLFLDRTLGFNKDLEAKIAALTSADIKKALAKHLSADGLTLIKAGDLAGK